MYPTKFVRCPLRRDGGKGAPSLSIQVHLVTQTCFVAVATVDSTLLELFSLTTAGPSAWVLDERRWWITEVPLDHCAPGSEGYQVCSCLALRMSCWASPHLAGRWRHKVVIDNLRCIHMAHRGWRWGIGVVPPLASSAGKWGESIFARFSGMELQSSTHRLRTSRCSRSPGLPGRSLRLPFTCSQSTAALLFDAGFQFE